MLLKCPDLLIDDLPLIQPFQSRLQRHWHVALEKQVRLRNILHDGQFLASPVQTRVIAGCSVIQRKRIR